MKTKLNHFSVILLITLSFFVASCVEEEPEYVGLRAFVEEGLEKHEVVAVKAFTTFQNPLILRADLTVDSMVISTDDHGLQVHMAMLGGNYEDFERNYYFPFDYMLEAIFSENPDDHSQYYLSVYMAR